MDKNRVKDPPVNKAIKFIDKDGELHNVDAIFNPTIPLAPEAPFF